MLSRGMGCGMGDTSSCLLTRLWWDTKARALPRWEVQDSSTTCPEHGPGVDSQAVEALVPLSLWRGELGKGSENSLQAQLRGCTVNGSVKFCVSQLEQAHFYFNPLEMTFWGWFPNGAGDFLPSRDFSHTHGGSDVSGHEQDAPRC